MNIAASRGPNTLEEWRDLANQVVAEKVNYGMTIHRAIERLRMGISYARDKDVHIARGILLDSIDEAIAMLDKARSLSSPPARSQLSQGEGDATMAKD